jgi:hypothetical protein
MAKKRKTSPAAIKYEWKIGGPKRKLEAPVFGKWVESVAHGRPVLTIPISEYRSALDQETCPAEVRKAFTWDREKALELNLAEELRFYLRHLNIIRVSVTTGQTISTRAFYSVVDVENDTRGYASDAHVRGNRDLGRQVLDQARRELLSYVAKWRSMCEEFGSYIPDLTEITDNMAITIEQMSRKAAT